MNVYFYDDGTFTTKAKKDKEVSFCAIDISTVRKGPIFSFVKEPNFEPKDPIHMSVLMNYGNADLPFEAGNVFETDIRMDYPNYIYNTYPLLKQMIHCNFFVEGQSKFCESYINIAQINLQRKKKAVEITESTTDKQLDKIFNSFGIKTDMSDIVDSKDVILMNKRGYWKLLKIGQDRLANIAEDYRGISQYMKDMKWDLAFICMPEIETAYLIKQKTLQEIEDIRRLKVSIRYHDDVEPGVPYTGGDYIFECKERDPEGVETYYDAENIEDILKICLFVPQILNIETSLYNTEATVEITAANSMQTLRLTIDRKEARFAVNTCIFNLLERMLSIRMDRRDVKEEYSYEKILSSINS